MRSGSDIKGIGKVSWRTTGSSTKSPTGYRSPPPRIAAGANSRADVYRRPAPARPQSQQYHPEVARHQDSRSHASHVRAAGLPKAAKSHASHGSTGQQKTCNNAAGSKASRASAPHYRAVRPAPKPQTHAAHAHPHPQHAAPTQPKPGQKRHG